MTFMNHTNMFKYNHVFHQKNKNIIVILVLMLIVE